MYEDLVKRLREHGEFLIVSDRMKAPPNVNVRNVFSEDYAQAADAIEELSREYESIAASLNESVELVRKLQSPRWIPAAERLPEKNGKYICYVKRFGQYAGKQYYYVDVLVFQENCFFEDGIGTERVTHWMPLPEPLREGA